MTADVQRELAEVMHRHESGSGWDGCTACTARIAALLPTVRRLIVDAEKRAAAAALRDAADGVPRFSPAVIAKWLRDRAAALDPVGAVDKAQS